MGKPFFYDTLFNLVSGLGTAKDKAAFSRYVFSPLSKDQLDAAYRSDWIARKIISIPAQDSTREWRDWQADNDQIEALEAEEKRLGVQQKLRLSMIRARLYGGCALIMGIADQDPEEELDPDSVGEGDLKWIHSVGRWELSTGPLIWDINSPWYGEPEWYQRRLVGINPNESLADVKIHPSRVVRLIGAEIPDPAVNTESGWGDSVLQAVNDAVINSSTVISNIATLLAEAKVDVVKIPGLTEHLSSKEYQNRLTERFSYANTAKSIVNTIVLDKEEEWNRIEANVGASSPLIREYLALASGAADIPATRMLGESPRGMNATGVSDIRNYYDRIASDQASDLTPALDRLDAILIRSALGKFDPTIFYSWVPLWQLDSVQKGTLDYQKAQTFQIDLNAGLIPSEVLREARQNQLIEDGFYPGLEAVLDDWEGGLLKPDPEPPPQPPQLVLTHNTPPPTGVVPSGPERTVPSDALRDARHEHRNRKGKFRRVPQHLSALMETINEHSEQMRRTLAEYVKNLPDDVVHPPVGDAAPRTLYVRRDVLNGAEIVGWAKAQGFETTVPPDEMHVTVTFSRAPVDWMKMGGDSWGGGPEGESVLIVPEGGPRVVERLGKATVLSFASSPLAWRHEDMVRNGASWDFAEYQPHVTITFESGPADLRGIEPYRGAIKLGPEIFEEVNDNWTVTES